MAESKAPALPPLSLGGKAPKDSDCALTRSQVPRPIQSTNLARIATPQRILLDSAADRL